MKTIRKFEALALRYKKAKLTHYNEEVSYGVVVEAYQIDVAFILRISHTSLLPTSGVYVAIPYEYENEENTVKVSTDINSRLLKMMYQAAKSNLLNPAYNDLLF